MSLQLEYVDYSASWWAFGALGGIASACIIFLLLCHTVWSLYHISKLARANREDQLHTENTSIYLLCVAYFILGVLANMLYTFIRSTLLSDRQSTQFTLLQCQFGYISSLLLFGLNRVLFYVIIIQRIKWSFKGTSYGYRPMLFLFLYWLISILCTLHLLLWTLSQSDSLWFLVSNTADTFSFCSKPLSALTASELFMRGALMTAEVAFKFYLMYLFWNELWKLYHKLADEMNLNDEEKQAPDAQFVDEQLQALKILCELVKKQTILLFPAVCSTFVFYMFAAISFEGNTLLSWDTMVNSLCVWLMFTGNEKYWNCCTKYGCCCCCYLTRNLDEYLSQQIE